MESAPPLAVVTGVGALTPLGRDAPTMWQALLAGGSGIRELYEPWAGDLPVRIAAPVAAEPGAAPGERGFGRLDRSAQLAVVAAREAWADAGLGPAPDALRGTDPDPSRGMDPDPSRGTCPDPSRDTGQDAPRGSGGAPGARNGPGPEPHTGPGAGDGPGTGTRRGAGGGCPDPFVRPEDVAVVVGTGHGPQGMVLSSYERLKERGANLVSPYAMPMYLVNTAAAQVGIAVGARAGVYTVASACASGAEAVAFGLELIRSGRAKVVVAGGTDATVTSLTIAAFAAMRALSRRTGDPTEASRPFDRSRDGFVVGEGAGMVVLEDAALAGARGAGAYCEVAGGGVTSDGHHIAQPFTDGRGLADAMRLALRQAGESADRVALVNAHATSTPIGDAAEARALRALFGRRLPEVPVCAPKSGMGHLQGAAGAVETVITALSLHHRTVPPTLNSYDTEEHVGLELVLDKPRPLPDGSLVALNNSLGFGGHNVAVVQRTLPAGVLGRSR
ncbi:beta-ketoacyl synthase N-terminal-like domain-containing protein [Streptomyces sp. NPDC050504]|uniref:beta-ketoacyl-[acyl-carrier-protein] synthase family protein n=1 Tax=Streptomyces sp. NPDC050504 TaxID=3365618 RepID=UPI00379B2B8E